MAKSQDVLRSAVQRLRELLPGAAGWDEAPDVRIGTQVADIVARFRIGTADHILVLDVVTLAQPRQIRQAVTSLAEVRREMPGAYPVAVAEYVSPESAALLKRGGVGYLDLSGNCYLAFENVLIEKEGKRNLRPSTRPLKSLFAPRASRVVRVLLVDPQHAWRLEELAKAAEVSLGHAHNVVRRLQDLAWVDRDEHQRIRLGRPGELLEGWVASYRYTQNTLEAYFSPERVTRRLMGEVGRVCHGEGRRYAFTLHSGAALVAPNVRAQAIHCYLEGGADPVARALGLRPVAGGARAEAEGNVHFLAPYDAGVFYAPITKSGLPVVCLPQLYADLYHHPRRGREQARHLRREAMGY